MSPPEVMVATTWTALPCSGPPAPIEDLRVDAATTVDLSWSPAAGAAAYRTYRYLAPDRSDPPVVLTTTAPSASDDVLGNGASYFYDVRGVNACGESPR